MSVNVMRALLSTVVNLLSLVLRRSSLEANAQGSMQICLAE
ncbi:MAG: hypothetical protein ACI8W7_004927 [Gammaproteobacteria bacterium]|jgi:hypothetical protein